MRVFTLCVFGWLVGLNIALADSLQSPMAKEFQIEVDSTALNPPIVWAISGVTESIQSLHPLVSDKIATLKLRPGRYNYQATTFSFEFTVNLDGKLDFRKSLDQCITGRGTALLTVKCRRTQPF
jgi:hypothetical protein